eukprot:6197588-Pleurochrysis_carterae.AAC.1
MSRTRERPGGTDERSMSSQLPLDVWFAISARSAAVHPVRSSRRACLRVLGVLHVVQTAAANCQESDGRPVAKRIRSESAPKMLVELVVRASGCAASTGVVSLAVGPLANVGVACGMSAASGARSGLAGCFALDAPVESKMREATALEIIMLRLGG